ncbi:MAG: protein-tyrosine phosphatase family protein [Nitrospiraceae bacterium]
MRADPQPCGDCLPPVTSGRLQAHLPESGYTTVMYYITETVLVGNVYEARMPPPFIKGLLFVAEEFEITPPDGMIFGRVALKEFHEAHPVDVSRAVEWLEQHASSQRVLVCCRAGMGRSVSMVIAYLCCVKGMQYTEAVDLLTTRRPGSVPLPELERTIQQVQQMRNVGAVKPDQPIATHAVKKPTVSPDRR